MFGRSKPVSFERYAYTSRRRRSSWWPLPSWLTILLIGIALGAGGLWYAQEEYLPPRLSAAESERLQTQLATVEGERDQLRTELGQTKGRLQSSESEVKRLSGELEQARESIDALEKDIELFVVSLPDDPRARPIGIRSARFGSAGDGLDYRVLLTDDRNASGRFAGVMQLVVLGSFPGRSEERIELDPIEVAIDGYLHVRGRVPLPAGFAPRQVTILVFDRPGGRELGLRIYNVR
ncbi:MAG: hypothetical protein JSW68_13000 [Burkholderiales bacterium]|nr:MAG: hypothetical protein JSW68_13000 [Burkholderiales bacterium]